MRMRGGMIRYHKIMALCDAQVLVATDWIQRFKWLLSYCHIVTFLGKIGRHHAR